MDMVEEHSSNHRPDDDGMGMVEERLEVDDIVTPRVMDSLFSIIKS
jgi:hypothetical protein